MLDTLLSIINSYVSLGVTIQWTGLLEWNTGLDYWTGIFFVFIHYMAGFIEFHQLLNGHLVACSALLNTEY